MTRIPDYPEMPLHANGLKATPLVVNGVMYIMTAYNLNTGDIAWQVPTGRGQN